MKIDALLIESNVILSNVIAELIAANPRVNSVARVGSAKEMRKLFLQDNRQWGLILLDLNVPTASGREDLSIAQEIQRLGKERVTCILAHGHEFLSQVRADGFQGYILKTLPTREFSQALRRVIAGEKVFITN